MRCIVVDDDPVSRGAIEHFCEINEHVQNVESFESAVGALNFLSNNEVDIVFL